MDWIFLLCCSALEDGIRRSVKQVVLRECQEKEHGPLPPPQPRVTVMMWVPLIVVAIIACIVLSYK